MVSGRKAILSTGTLFSIREYEGEEEEEGGEEEDDGKSIDIMGFLAEEEDTVAEEKSISPATQQDREEDHECITTTPPFKRHRIMEMHAARLKEQHDALVKCLYDSEPESSERDQESPIKADTYRWTPSPEDLNKVCGQAVSKAPPIPHLRGGALFPSKNKPSPRPQIISRPSEAFSRVSENSTSAGRELRVPRVRHLQASVVAGGGLGYSVSGLEYGGYSTVASIVPEGSVASWYPGVGERRTGAFYGGEGQAAVELDAGEVGGGNHEDRTGSPPGTVSRTDEKEGIESDAERGISGPIHELGSPMESPRKSTWRNFSRPPTGSVLSDGSKLRVQSSISGSTTASQRTFFAPERYEDLGGRPSLEPSGAAPYSPTQMSTTEQAPSDSGPALLLPERPHLLGILPESTRAPRPGNHSIWDGGSHPSIIPEESPSEIAAWRAHREASLRRNDAFATRQDPHAKERSEAQFREKLLYMWNTYQTRMKLIDEDRLKTVEEKKAATKDEHHYLELQIAQASTDTGFELLHSPLQTQSFISSLFFPPAPPSKTPSLLRKTNKVMKWILAIPNDPGLKTHSSRNATSTASSSVRRNQSSATDTRGTRYVAPPAPMSARPRMEGARLTEGEGRRLHFAPAGVVREEGKGGKVGSAVSRGTEWPTQSGLGGGRF